MADPYSIRIDKPPLPSTLLRKTIYPILQKMIKNEDVIDLFEADTEELRNRFIKVVKSMNMYNPKVISLLYASTPQGLIEELIRKFESSRSVQQLLIIKHGIRKSDAMLRKLIRAEYRLQEWRVRRVKGLNLDLSRIFHDWPRVCSTDLANQVREASWGKPIESITMPALQHLMIYTTPLASGGSEYHANNHFEYKVHPIIESITPYQNRHFSTGGLKPFLGHSTSTGTVPPLIQFSEKDPMLSKLKTLLELISWTSTTYVSPGGQIVASNVDKLIRYLAGLYTKEGVEEMAPFAGKQKSGTIAHHIRAPSFRESIVPNCLSNIYQQISGDSNTHITFRTKADHFYINFLHILCYTVKILSFELEFGHVMTTPPIVWGVTTPCPYCNRAIVETPITIDEDLIPHRRLRPLASTRVEKTGLKILKDSYNAFLEKGVLRTADSEENIIDVEIAYVGIMQEIVEDCVSMHDTLVDRYTHHHMTQAGLDTFAAITTKEYNRVIGQRELKWMPMTIAGPKLSAIVYTLYSPDSGLWTPPT